MGCRPYVARLPVAVAGFGAAVARNADSSNRCRATPRTILLLLHISRCGTPTLVRHHDCRLHAPIKSSRWMLYSHLPSPLARLDALHASLQADARLPPRFCGAASMQASLRAVCARPFTAASVGGYPLGGCHGVHSLCSRGKYRSTKP